MRRLKVWGVLYWLIANLHYDVFCFFFVNFHTSFQKLVILLCTFTNILQCDKTKRGGGISYLVCVEIGTQYQGFICSTVFGLSPNTVSVIVLWQWSTPSRLTPAISLPSLLVRPSGRTSLSHTVWFVISGYLACWQREGWFGFYQKLVICCPSVHRCRALPVGGICGDLGGTLWGEVFGPLGRWILFKLAQAESILLLLVSLWEKLLFIWLFTDSQVSFLSLSSLIFLFSTLFNTHPFIGQQASRESLSSSLSGDVSEAGLSSTQGAFGAPVTPQPSGSPAAAAAPVSATPSKVGHRHRRNWKNCGPVIKGFLISHLILSWGIHYNITSAKGQHFHHVRDFNELPFHPCCHSTTRRNLPFPSR